MNSSKVFNSQARAVGGFAHAIKNDQIKNEPMFFNCSLEFAYNNGGPITRSFIMNLPDDWNTDQVVFDSRVHMLMPGWYPAIPGITMTMYHARIFRLVNTLLLQDNLTMTILAICLNTFLVLLTLMCVLLILQQELQSSVRFLMANLSIVSGTKKSSKKLKKVN